MTRKLEALIFDVDGTLAETERLGHLPAFNRAFAEAGLEWRWSEALYGELLKVGGGKERITRYLRDHGAVLPPAMGEVADVIPRLHQAKNRHYAAAMARGELPPRPGVVRLMKEAQAGGLRLAIATTTSPENVDALLTHSFGPDVAAWFDVVGAGDVVPHKKPAPDIYHYVLDELGLCAQACLALEDTANGVQSAVGAGIPTVVTVSDYSRGEDFSGAVLVVDQLGEPDRPMTVLGGDACGHRWVDLALLRKLHARAVGGQQVLHGA
ncbi:MAG TPA: HAD family hydrolase [Gammaproteobacteria bacterium]|nr:HAD family hydrolase [Gammaproteobacteria bacterium]